MAPLPHNNTLIFLTPPHTPHSNQLMQLCWKRYASDRPHFEHIVNTLSNYLEKLKRPDSVYCNSDTDSDEDAAGNHIQRQGSGKAPGRTPSMRSGRKIIRRGNCVYSMHVCILNACVCVYSMHVCVYSMHVCVCVCVLNACVCVCTQCVCVCVYSMHVCVCVLNACVCVY